MFKQGNNPARGAGAQGRTPQGQSSDIVGVKAIDILVRPNALGHLVGVDVSWKRKLNQDTVDGAIPIEIVNQIQQLCFRCFIRQVV